MLELPRAKGEVIVPDEILSPVEGERRRKGRLSYKDPSEQKIPTSEFMRSYAEWDAEMTQRLYDRYGGLRDFMRGRTGT